MRSVRTVAVVTALVALAACNGGESETSAGVHDVQYFVDHPDDRKATLEKCHNNPGELSDEPNCKNASAAEREAFIDAAQQALKTDN